MEEIYQVILHCILLIVAMILMMFITGLGLSLIILPFHIIYEKFTKKRREKDDNM